MSSALSPQPSSPLVETQYDRRGHNFYPPVDDRKAIPGLGETAGTPIEEIVVHYKIFGGATDFWVTELDEETGEAFGFMSVGGRASWTYAYLPELEAVNVPPGGARRSGAITFLQPGLVLERECHTSPETLLESDIPRVALEHIDRDRADEILMWERERRAKAAEVNTDDVVIKHVRGRRFEVRNASGRVGEIAMDPHGRWHGGGEHGMGRPWSYSRATLTAEVLTSQTMSSADDPRSRPPRKPLAKVAFGASAEQGIGFIEVYSAKRGEPFYPTVAEIRAIPKLYEMDGQCKDRMAYLKFVGPARSLWVTEYDPTTGEAFGHMEVDTDNQFGYFNLWDLERAFVQTDMYGYEPGLMRRDHTFTPRPLSECGISGTDLEYWQRVHNTFVVAEAKLAAKLEKKPGAKPYTKATHFGVIVLNAPGPMPAFVGKNELGSWSAVDGYGRELPPQATRDKAAAATMDVQEPDISEALELAEAAAQKALAATPEPATPRSSSDVLPEIVYIPVNLDTIEDLEQMIADGIDEGSVLIIEPGESSEIELPNTEVAAQPSVVEPTTALTLEDSVASTPTVDTPPLVAPSPTPTAPAPAPKPPTPVVAAPADTPPFDVPPAFDFDVDVDVDHEPATPAPEKPAPRAAKSAKGSPPADQAHEFEAVEIVIGRGKNKTVELGMFDI